MVFEFLNASIVLNASPLHAQASLEMADAKEDSPGSPAQRIKASHRSLNTLPTHKATLRASPTCAALRFQADRSTRRGLSASTTTHTPLAKSRVPRIPDPAAASQTARGPPTTTTTRRLAAGGGGNSGSSSKVMTKEVTKEVTKEAPKLPRKRRMTAPAAGGAGIGPIRFALSPVTAPLSTPTPPHCRYRYLLLPGNNSGLVREVFRRRPWWGKVPEVPAAVDGSALGLGFTGAPLRWNLRWKSITDKIPWAEIQARLSSKLCFPLV